MGLIIYWTDYNDVVNHLEYFCGAIVYDHQQTICVFYICQLDFCQLALP